MLLRIERRMLSATLFFYFMALFNRELLIFGLDLRIFAGVFGLLLLCVNIASKKVHTEKSNAPLVANKKILLFFLVLIFCNISWASSKLVLNFNDWIIVLASILFNFEFFIITIVNKSKLNWDYAKKFFYFSAIILSASVLLAFLGLDLRMLGASGAGGYSDGVSKSLISPLRFGGFALDPNFATLFFFMILAAAIYDYRRLRIGGYLLFVPVSIFGILASFSKALMLMVPVAVVAIHIRRSKISSAMKDGALLLVFIATAFIAIFNIKFGDSLTLNIRSSLWHSAVSYSAQNPLSAFVGNGLTAARSAASEEAWYVQPHSSIIQIFVDTGIVGIVLIYFILRGLMRSENKVIAFVSFIFLANFATYETIYQTYFWFIISVLPILLSKDTTKLKYSQRELADV